MIQTTHHRRLNCLMGALVADAAALGFHWLYDQARIRAIAPQSPEFHPINAQDYMDVPGYFAHAARQTGDLSQYGEQLWTLMQSIHECDGVYNASHYEQTFREHFGYGGRYVGYIDRPTRDTLDCITREETALLDKANKIEFSGTQQDRNALMSKVRSYSQMLNGDALRARVKTVVQQTHDQPAMIDYAFALCELIEQADGVHGADDQQLPAVSKLPALACIASDSNHASDDYLNQVESAVRVTNNNDIAVDYAKALAILLKSLVDGDDMSTAMATCRSSASESIAQRFDQVEQAKGLSIEDAVTRFGLACDLDYAFPSILYILQNTNSFSEAVQANIYAGGDSCGRAIIIGAAMGALHADQESIGIPPDWISQLSNAHSLTSLARALAA